MMFVYPILFIVFFLFYDYTDTLFPPATFVVSLLPGEISSGSIGQEHLSWKSTRLHIMVEAKVVNGWLQRGMQ